jgi:hypothetical protein
MRNPVRTTNTVEAWHRGINKKLGVVHPNIGNFINCLQKEEEIVRCNFLKATMGLIEYPKRNWEKEGKFYNIVKNYEWFESFGFFVSLEAFVHWGLHE